MDLLASYESDSSDNANNQEHDKSSKDSKSPRCLNNVDYFNLSWSSSDDDWDEKVNIDKTRTLATILSDTPYYPQKEDCEKLAESLEQNFNAEKFPCMNNSNNHMCKVNYENSSVKTDDTGVLKNAVSNAKFAFTNETLGASVGNKIRYTSNASNKKLRSDNNCSATSTTIKGNFECHISTSFSEKMKDYNDRSMSGIIRMKNSRREQTENLDVEVLPYGVPKKQVKIFASHSGAISALRWGVSQHSHLLLSSSLDSCLKIWDVITKTKVQDIQLSSFGIKAVQWMPCGTAVICGGYDKMTHIFDIESSKEVRNFSLPSYVSSVAIHPVSQDLFVAGTKDKILAFDTRNKTSEPIRNFESKCGQVLDMKFLENGSEFVCSTEIVSGDSADRTIMAWDFSSGALISNQIFHERYTCPQLQVDPSYKYFVAQTNGNYIAIFSSHRPYKMNRNKRYEGHKVLGYPIGCDFNSNGKFLASGDAEGGFYIYCSHTAQLIKRQIVNWGVPTTEIKWHPNLQSTVAVASWNGEIQLWQ